VCGGHLPAVRIRARYRRCDSCRENAHTLSSPRISIPSPPSSPLTPPPSSLPPPLFDRQLGSHLPLSPIERSAAVVLTRIGETQQQAAEQIGCTRKTVAHWQHHFDDKKSVLDEERGGRPRETTENEDEDIVFISMVDHFFTPREILHELNLNISARTVDRRLQKSGLFGRVARRKRVFTEEEMKKRLAFAEGYKHWKKEDWERVLFADESIIQGRRM
jgi:transposase